MRTAAWYTLILVSAVMPLQFQTFLLSLPKAALALASDDGSREGTAEVGELVHHVQSLSVDGDGGLYLWVTRCWLVHELQSS